METFALVICKLNFKPGLYFNSKKNEVVNLTALVTLCIISKVYS